MAEGTSQARSRTLPVVLIAAAVQGWALYALHMAIKESHWPATAPAWLLGLYAIAVFIPLTVQLTALHVEKRIAWIIGAALTVLFFYFGWHHGAHVMDTSAARFVDSGDWSPFAFILGVLWLLVLPFIQCRLVFGTWRVRYEALFATAWHNKLLLAEAALFTGLLWLLLVLWAALFKMLGIGFFKELFEEPLFIYPVTSLAFGIAQHLIGSLERLTSVVLEQLLNVLKWLALVAGLILACFTLALVMKLPGMIASGNRAIGAAWLLWLVAVTVLLVNAAYRDGTISDPYPRWIGLALRCVIPLAVIISITALYALYLRFDAYGITVERVWALIVAAAGCIYAAGYAFAAIKSPRWMAGVATVNVVAALFLIAALSLALTPVLSPFRIAANSQFALALSRDEPPQKDELYGRRGVNDSPMHYLRFSAGKYGERRLHELAELQDHPRAEEIRETAATLMAQKNRWERPVIARPKERLANIAVFPQGKSIDAKLLERLEQDLRNPSLFSGYGDNALQFGGVFVDLNADGIDEFVFIVLPAAHLYEREADGWVHRGQLVTNNLGSGNDLTAALLAGKISVVEPKWRELAVGGHRFRVNE